MKTIRNVAIVAVLAAVVIVGAYVAIKYIIPSIVTEVAVTGVPTPNNSRFDALKTSQAQTATARPQSTATTTGALIGAPGSAIVSIAYVPPVVPVLPAQENLYTSCTAVRGITPTPSDAAPTPTVMPTAEPTAEAAPPSGEANFVFLTISAEESEACYQVGEILRDRFNFVVGVTKTIAGEVAIDLNNVANSQMGDEFNVNLAEIKSDQGNRDRWMISGQGFNFNAQPIAKLTNTQLIGLPARPYVEGETLTFQIVGELTIKDTTRQLTFNSTAKYENDVLVVTAYTDTKLTEIGLFPPDLGFVKVNDEVRIILNLVARPTP